MKIDIGKIGSIPLILGGIFWIFVNGFAGALHRGFIPSSQTIEDTLFVEIPLILILLGIWLPHSAGTLFIGRIGTIIWLLPMGVLTIIIFGELDHAAPIALVVYFVIAISSILVTLDLWRCKKRRNDNENNPC